jgi:hypothetical protein
MRMAGQVHSKLKQQLKHVQCSAGDPNQRGALPHPY